MNIATKIPAKPSRNGSPSDEQKTPINAIEEESTSFKLSTEAAFIAVLEYFLLAET